MRRQGFLWAVTVASATLGSGRAEAGLLTLEATGSFGPTSTLGGTAFGADTPYSFRAVFDPAADRNPTPGDVSPVRLRFAPPTGDTNVAV